MRIDPERRRRSRGVVGWRGSIHMDLAGQRAPEVAAAREEWSARVREREEGTRGWVRLGAWEGVRVVGWATWVRQAGRWIRSIRR